MSMTMSMTVSTAPSGPERYQLSLSVGLGKVIMLHFPKAALPLRAPGLEPLFARQLPTDAELGAILARYLTSVASALEKSEVAGGDELAAPEARRRALVAKIEAFIEGNLGDPDLTPSAIAGHCHISLGHLHRLFHSRELAIAAWIRHRRLECCRADLADPSLRLWPVHAIGARWGFTGAAEFSRAFRAAYGSAPGRYRRQALNED
ncbi:AraC-like DNA-binding protein [Catenulispora sp. MAP12-49]|uniref:helix-turn-helix domain-containing protein n=1 Tax=Catenulispora sp. MAP12-49 TaxID=3156302 RepID=UPI0035177F80